MEIYLDNIGLIQDSTVKLDGLTVIAGENNSGKSTVGKALYAIVDGMIDIDGKQERDELSYCHEMIFKGVKPAIQTLLQTRPSPSKGLGFFLLQDNQAFGPAVSELLSGESIGYTTRRELLALTEKLIDELSELRLEHISADGENSEQKTGMSQFQEQVLRLCEATRRVLAASFAPYEFRALYIDYALKNEFQGEIQPVKNYEQTSKIILTSESATLFTCSLEDNAIQQDSFEALPNVFAMVFFIDNAFLLDDVNTGTTRRKSVELFNQIDTVVNKSLILSHREKLVQFLEATPEPNITNMLNKAGKYAEISAAVNPILPGNLNATPQGLKYEHEGVSLKAVNLATGSKMFAIIKMILDRYAFDEGTLLILDEPEAHLHPKWQNAFAEIIVLLVKELGVRVLLTSHSTHFVLALDAHMRQYNIIGKTNFYKTNVLDDGFVKYKCVNDDLTAIYDDFAAPYAVSKYIRDREYYGRDE